METSFVLKHGIVPVDMHEFCTETTVFLKKHELGGVVDSNGANAELDTEADEKICRKN